MANSPDINGLKLAIETRNITGMFSWFADDATLTIYDQNNPPPDGLVLRRPELDDMLREVFARDLKHEVLYEFMSPAGRLAYVEKCTYPDGLVVMSTAIAKLRNGLITDMTQVSAWDNGEKNYTR